MIISERKKLGVYVHIPFCVKKCSYCDFLSFAEEGEDGDSIRASYVKRLLFEIAARAGAIKDAYDIDSIYIGGGTPSLLTARDIDEILEALYAQFRVDDDVEITIEANPGTVDIEKFKGYLSAGINRLSLGLQSFDDQLLRYLGRIHSGGDAKDAFYDARSAGFDNINLDLIFGMSNETEFMWKTDIDEVLSLAPEHISFYSLQIEEGTPIADDMMAGLMPFPSEIADRRMYHYAIERLTAAGYRHYEISNAALPGCESRHNLKYWSMDEYLGLGLGAHSFLGGSRFANTEDLERYMTAGSVRPLTVWSHRNTVRDDIAEYIFLGLRKTDGIDIDDFNRVFDKDFLELFNEETEGLIGRRLLERDGSVLRLTPLGLDLANEVFREFV